MTDKNPFEDLNREIEESVSKQLELVKELDTMDVDVTSWEAGFLDNALKQLEKKIPLSQPQLDVLHRMCQTYDIDYEDY